MRHLVIILLGLGCLADDLVRREWHDLLEWLVSQGGYVHPGLQLGAVTHGGIAMAGVTTGTALAEGDVVIELPRNSLLDLELLGSLPEYTALASTVPNCSLSHGMHRSLRTLKLLTILAAERAKGAASQFSAYLRMLPTKEDLHESDLYYAGEDTLRDFQSLPVVNFWHRIQREHYQEFERCFEVLKVQLLTAVDWQEVELMLRIHRSRYFTISEPFNLEFLGPVADSVNTGTSAEQNVKVVLAVGDLSRNMTLQFVVSKDIRAGEELISSYFTGLDNEDIFFRWNMYLEGSEIDLDASAAAAACIDLDLRRMCLEALEPSSLPVPRCNAATLRREQGMMRCSLARLAYELCAQGWLGATLAGPAPQGPKGARIAGYLVMFSIILRNRGDRAGAKAALQDLFTRAEQGLEAESLGDALLQMAEWLVEEGQLEQAEEHIRQALKLREGAVAHFKLGTVLFARGDYLHALRSLQASLQMSAGGTPLHEECSKLILKSKEALGLGHVRGTALHPEFGSHPEI